MQAAVIVFPGSNCDRDVAVALGASMGRPPLMVWHGDSALPAVDLIVIPGGFAYGDYLRAGAIAAHSPVMREVVARARAGAPLLAICNGFQVAAESGLLPGALLPNAGLKFVCRDVYIRTESSGGIFTGHYQRGQVIRLPVAHHAGNYHIDDDGLKALEDNAQVAFRYCTPGGEPGDGANPNGSRDDIAGVYNEAGTVLGLMPHPERLADPRLGGDDGKAMFDSLVAALG
ncbi:MAG: phosphoribosylformylglycinamidine synthase subunit PurQ [Proteobacteria bacterium]|nr:phosphoribosylformylglycinamidine synthase subunit PurQ [Pseudomonadota bacterium]